MTDQFYIDKETGGVRKHERVSGDSPLLAQDLVVPEPDITVTLTPRERVQESSPVTFRHFRHLGITVAFVKWRDNEVEYAVAQCGRKDQFQKARGREIAQGRLAFGGDTIFAEEFEKMLELLFCKEDECARYKAEIAHDEFMSRNRRILGRRVRDEAARLLGLERKTGAV